VEGGHQTGPATVGGVVEGDVVTPGGITVPASSITWRFSRGTGPGGQGVNTTDSRVELVVDLTALDAPGDVVDRVRGALGDSIRIVVTTERSQLRNREAAVERLVARLDAAAVPDRPRTPTRPTRSSVRARLDSKRQQSQRKAGRRDPGEDGA
jgi:ribosome-associated protein